jgi:hypothetical protein
MYLIYQDDFGRLMAARIRIEAQCPIRFPVMQGRRDVLEDGAIRLETVLSLTDFVQTCDAAMDRFYDVYLDASDVSVLRGYPEPNAPSSAPAC